MLGRRAAGRRTRRRRGRGDAVVALLADGVSARDAAAEVATTLGVPKRRAYAIATALRRP